VSLPAYLRTKKSLAQQVADLEAQLATERGRNHEYEVILAHYRLGFKEARRGS